ncbi:uncharacterized protein [Cicer arietinum]|uniref:Uncharacterized protein LOC101513508 n=1 Tax=Cicer arietinum TaxID=3827 RepID=A0A1S2YEU9_CICAR|nr:uncharacterized protein LOC101513508 [Cicer arietinum]
MCSEPDSPRFSFSYDLSESQQKVSTMKHDVSCRDTNVEFEFSTSRSIEFETSCADELFSNGVILPMQINQDKKNNTTKSQNTKLPPRPCSTKIKKENIIKEVQEITNTQTNSFWGFKRSKSLNCNDTKKSFTCFSPPLSRSNSTGSSPNLKRMNSNRQQYYSSSCSVLNLYPVQKCCSGKSYVNGFRISPVLNIPNPSCFSKGSVSLFGFGSFLGVGKGKKNNKY